MVADLNGPERVLAIESTGLGPHTSVDLFPSIFKGSLHIMVFKDPLRIDGPKLTDACQLCHLMNSYSVSL